MVDKEEIFATATMLLALAKIGAPTYEAALILSDAVSVRLLCDRTFADRWGA